MAVSAQAQSNGSLDDFITISSIPAEYRDSAVLGAIPFKATLIDPRDSYCMYVPEAAFTAVNETGSKLPLVVNIHGTSRRAEQCRDSLQDFADSRGAAVLAPLFPYGINDPNDADNYKEVLYRGIRYDEILLGMLEEVEVRYEGIIETDRFFLMGFSGGGQYAHRFLYLHPERLHAASIGAPGTVTSLNESSWPEGVGDTNELFGVEVDVEKIKAVKLHLVVGELDDGVVGEGISDVLGSQAGVAGRMTVLNGLQSEWKQLGIGARLDIMPGVEHDAIGVLPAQTSFLKSVVPKAELNKRCG